MANSLDRKPVPELPFEKLVNEHSRRVLGLAWRVLGRMDLAQDVHQEVFLAVWKRWASFNGQTHWPGYLYRSTVRTALRLAKRGRRVAPIDAIDPPDGSPPPEAAVRFAELQTRLAEALATLSEHQAQAFILVRLEGQSYDQAAEVLGCSVPTVRVHLHRAMQELARKLRNELIG